MGDELNPALYQGILNMTGRGLHLKDASNSGAPGLRGQDQVYNPDTVTVDPESALYNLLATKYKLGPKEAESYTKYYMRGTDAQSQKIRAEALEGKIGGFAYPQDSATRTVKGIEDARAAAMLQQAQAHEDMKAAKSERTVGAFVLGGIEKAKYGNLTPATQQVLGREMQLSDPYKPTPTTLLMPGDSAYAAQKSARGGSIPKLLTQGYTPGVKPIDNSAKSKPTISAPNGPYGYNYEEEAVPQLIPNAPSVPMGPYSPGKLLAPTDPEERQRWLAALPGGSL